MYKHILVPTDGSKLSARAVKQADGRIKYKRTKEYERCRRGAPAFEPEACRYGLA